MEENIKDAKEPERADTAAVGRDDAEPEGERHWYVIHTATGYENKVQTDLERKVRSMGLENKIFNVIVPMADEIVVKDGKKHTVKRKLFPGYVLVEMIKTNFSWYVVRNTPGVTRFVGPDGTEPSPLSQSEVDSILKAAGEKPRITYDASIAVGEGVRVIKGTYEAYTGTVTSIDEENGRVTIAMRIMDGKDATVELGLDEVEAY